ncbi:DUF1642 domain-containing protein [Enterococcus faecalis]|uniref:DUF1642 domain-containing protein n=1 Tax=Enterococcus faecalis TaxID=1351 RepID=UPI00145C3017|nr:DUF1642 domain-containing protein [Enterococcus faecalis]NMP43757.1 DUF1642 domain-containing protein [Enterococcus faecalis]
MNKQELIKELKEEKRKIEWKEDKYELHNAASGGKERAYSLAIDLAKKLDEPKKVVVPKFVAEWIEYAKKKGVSLIVSFNPWDLYGEEYIEATRWIDNNQETFALAWVNGYEVEKEQLYYVLLPETGEHELKYFLDQDGELSVDNQLCEYYKLTEQKIKAIDERYWPFAVKVEGKK